MSDAGFNVFCHGVLTALSAVAALCLLRFWVETKDRLFGLFAVAFSLLALHWGCLSVVAPEAQSRHWLFLIRLAAFLIIAVGIIDKNRESTS